MELGYRKKNVVIARPVDKLDQNVKFLLECNVA